MTDHLPPAGWYPDHTDQTTQRYWDGHQWTEHIAPATGISTTQFKRGTTSKKTTAVVVGVLLLLVVIGIAGCAALVYVGLDAQSITSAEYNSVHVGDDKQAVIDRLGTPYSTFDTENDSGSFSCVEYNVKDNISQTYQLCFSSDDNTLTFKQKYDD